MGNITLAQAAKAIIHQRDYYADHVEYERVELRPADDAIRELLEMLADQAKPTEYDL